MTDAIARPATPRAIRRAARAARKESPIDETATPRSRRRTGSGATINIDNIAVHFAVLVLISLAIIGGGTGSIEGLWHVAGWFESPVLQWTLPVAVDVFLIGLAILSLIFRRRRHYLAAVAAAVTTLLLVCFSSWANYSYQASVSDASSTAGTLGPIFKAALPWLLLLGIEFAAALLSTKTKSEKTAIEKRDARIKLQAAEIAALKKQLKAKTTPAADSSAVAA